MESTQVKPGTRPIIDHLMQSERLNQVLGSNPVTTMRFILMSVCAGVCGQLVLKYGMTQMGALTLSSGNLFSMVSRLVLSPWVLLGLAIYGAGTFFWLMVLSRVELSFAYPMLSTSYILILAASWLFLGESISPLRIAGVVTVVTGVVLISQS